MSYAWSGRIHLKASDATRTFSAHHFETFSGTSPASLGTEGNHHIMSKPKFKEYLSLLLSLSIAITPSYGWALDVELKTNYPLRDTEITKEIGELTKGSRIEIPDEYLVDKRGHAVTSAAKFDFEMTLNNWIRKAAKLNVENRAGLMTFREGKRDYFFPVKVKELGDGSHIDAKNVDKTKWIALDAIRRKGHGLIVRSNTKVKSFGKPKKNINPKRAQPQQEVASAKNASRKVYIKLKRNLLVRQYSEQLGEMERVTKLRRGSVVSIGGKYAVKNGEKVNLKATLNNWLDSQKSGESTAKKYDYDGHKKADFFPVEVLRNVGGSEERLSESLGSLHMGLRSLARRGNAEVTDDPAKAKKWVAHPTKAKRQTPSKKSLPAAVYSPLAKSADDLDDSRTHAGVLCVDCNIPRPLRKVQANLPITLGKLAKKISRDKRNYDLSKSKLAKRMKRTCNMEWKTFKGFMKAQARANDIAFELLQGIMIQESTGKCFAKNSEADTSSSLGLFQVNTKSASCKDGIKRKKCARIKGCTKTERTKIMNAKGNIEALTKGPKCLQNPVVGLQEAIKIFKEKERSLFKNSKRKIKFDENKMSKSDKTRLLLAAYNGGQRWVNVAAKDLNEFKRKNSGAASLDFNRWDDLRLFFFRRALNYKEQKQHFGSYIKWDKRDREKQRRGIKWAVINVAYAETIMPRRREHVVK